MNNILLATVKYFLFSLVGIYFL